MDQTMRTTTTTETAGSAWSKVRNDPWLIAKLIVMFGASFPAVYAIGFAIKNESLGVAMAIIPDMVVAGVILAGIIGATMFFDDDEHAHA